MQARVIGETELTRCEAYLARATAARSRQLRGFDYHNRFYGAKEHKGLRFVLSIAVGKRYVVVGYFNYITLVNASGETPDVYQLAFIPAKQIFRVLSFHFDAPMQSGDRSSLLFPRLCPLRLLLGPLDEKEPIFVGILQRDKAATPPFIRRRPNLGASLG